MGGNMRANSNLPVFHLASNNSAENNSWLTTGYVTSVCGISFLHKHCHNQSLLSHFSPLSIVMEAKNVFVVMFLQLPPFFRSAYFRSIAEKWKEFSTRLTVLSFSHLNSSSDSFFFLLFLQNCICCMLIMTEIIPLLVLLCWGNYEKPVAFQLNFS